MLNHPFYCFARDDETGFACRVEGYVVSAILILGTYLLYFSWMNALIQCCYSAEQSYRVLSLLELTIRFRQVCVMQSISYRRYVFQVLRSIFRFGGMLFF